MKKIYIILMHTNTFPSKIVKVFTRYKYTHVAIALEKNCDVLYSFGRKNLRNALKGGFTIETKTGEFFTFFNKTKCKICEIEITEKQYKDVKNIIENMKNNANKYKYDFIGIGFRFLKIPISFKNRYVCSNFVAQVLEKADIYTFDKKTCLIKPKDFESIPNLKLIYNGIYSKYGLKSLTN